MARHIALFEGNDDAEREERGQDNCRSGLVRAAAHRPGQCGSNEYRADSPACGDPIDTAENRSDDNPREDRVNRCLGAELPVAQIDQGSNRARCNSEENKKEQRAEEKGREPQGRSAYDRVKHC